eukprot:6584537-Pyramimonas_sp.AAC.1
MLQKIFATPELALGSSRRRGARAVGGHARAGHAQSGDRPSMNRPDVNHGSYCSEAAKPRSVRRLIFHICQVAKEASSVAPHWPSAARTVAQAVDRLREMPVSEALWR